MEAGPAADLYSLGVILHELVTGTQNWCDSDDPQWRRPSAENPYSDGLDDLVALMMRRDPANRPSSARTLLAMLAAL